MMNRRSTSSHLVKSMMAVGAFLLFSAALISYGQSGEKITHTVNGATDNWRIDQPNVKQHITPYPQIRFKPGDHITIQAGGCVQTWA